MSRRLRRPGFRRYTTRHLRVDLWERLAHRAVRRRQPIEHVVNAVIEAGLDAVGEPAVSPHRGRIGA